MLLRFYNSSYFPQFITLFLLGIFFWFNHLLKPEIFNEKIVLQPAFNLINNWISRAPYLGPMIGLICLYIQAFLLSNILISNQIIPRNSIIPAFLTILAGSLIPETLVFQPCSMALIFVIIAFGKLLRCYEKTEIDRNILSAGFYISLGSLFCFPVIYLIPLIYITLVAFSVSSWRDWLIPVIGAFIPYIYLFSYYYLTNSPELEFSKYKGFFMFSLDIQPRMSLIEYLIAGIWGLIIVISFIYYLKTIQVKNILVRKRMLITLWMLLIAIVLLFQDYMDFIWVSSLLFLPATVFISYHLGQLTKSRWLNILLWALIILLFINNNLLSGHA